MKPRTMVVLALAIAVTPLVAQRASAQRGGVESAIDSRKDPMQSMRRSLLDLASKQEIRYASTKRYSTDLGELGYQSQGGAVVRILSADGAGWSGSAAHAEATGKSCVVYFGKASAPTTEGCKRAARAAAVTCD